MTRDIPKRRHLGGRIGHGRSELVPRDARPARRGARGEAARDRGRAARRRAARCAADRGERVRAARAVRGGAPPPRWGPSQRDPRGGARGGEAHRRGRRRDGGRVRGPEPRVVRPGGGRRRGRGGGPVLEAHRAWIEEEAADLGCLPQASLAALVRVAREVQRTTRISRFGGRIRTPDHPREPPAEGERVCAFCGRPRRCVAMMVAGPRAALCDACVAACVSVLKNLGVEELREVEIVP
ncbi:MAG: ClpX C4-type zinc finger protein [Myxococcota bacterium]